jgi:hypothetical protein
MDSKPEKDWWDKFKKYVEIAGVIILAVYTFYTVKIYGANKEAAKAAAQTAKDTEAFFMADERAWVVLDIAPIKSHPASHQFPARIIYGFYPKNIGKTVARNVSLRVDGATNGAGKPAILGPETLAPGERAVASTVAPGDAPSNLRTTWSGRIDYIDTFHVPHWKTFCYRVIDEKGTLEVCTTGNDEDDNPEMAPGNK